jgi:hypothetical protein
VILNEVEASASPSSRHASCYIRNEKPPTSGGFSFGSLLGGTTRGLTEEHLRAVQERQQVPGGEGSW